MDLERLSALSEKHAKKYEILLKRAQSAVKKRLKGSFDSIDADALDEMIDREMRVFKVDYVRTRRKNSIRTNTHKLLTKAGANIEAVERGTFGVGH